MLANLLATGRPSASRTLIFQDGHLAGLLGFESQGFLDAWAPVFFFAMIFAIAMDYTVFLLSSAREHWEQHGDAREAMVVGWRAPAGSSSPPAAVMVAVFFTFALSGPLPPKEMGVILGVACCSKLPGPAQPAARVHAARGRRRLVSAPVARPGAARDPLRPR